MAIRSLSDLRRSDAARGVLLLLAAALSLLVVNSPLRSMYDAALDVDLGVRLGGYELEKAALEWVNEGLMAVFFLLVGIEIKREFREGALSERRRALLPVFAATGGILVPAVLYALVAWDEAPRGWAIPCATDIAFALGILALLGSRAPTSLKIFLTTMAVLDDVAAITIIAVFYAGDLELWAHGAAAAATVALVVVNRLGTTRLAPYLVIGAVLWVFVVESGVHATIAGVVTAVAIPATPERGTSPVEVLETKLETFVAFVILPLFAFVNAGVPLGGISMDDLSEPKTLGTVLGLVVGKPIGVIAACWIALRLGVARLPEGMRFSHVAGLGILAGIGFTLSLFIGGLAFPDREDMNDVRLGVLIASVVAGVLGYVVLRLQTGEPEERNRRGADRLLELVRRRIPHPFRRPEE